MSLSDTEMLAGLDASSTQTSAQDDQKNTLTIKLPAPISAGDRKISSITLREPTLYEAILAARQVRNITSPSQIEVMESEIELVRQASGLPDTLFSQIPADIIRQGRDYVVAFEETAREEVSSLQAEWGGTPPAEKTLHFTPAIEGGGKRLDIMTLRAPTVGQMRPARAILKNLTYENLFRSDELLIEAVSSWPKAAVLRLPVSSFIHAAGYLNAFFPPGR